MDDKDEPTLDLPVAEFSIRRMALNNEMVIKLSDGEMAIIDHVQALALAAYERTGRHVIREVVIDEEIGYGFGIMPGAAATISTASGAVLLRSRRNQPL